MEILFWFLVPSMLVVLGCKYFYGANICPKEMLAHMGVGLICCVVSVGIVYLSLYQSAYEQNLVHGEVTKKWREEVSCSHSYSCPPCRQECTTTTSGSGKSKRTSTSCRKVCSTCYRHFEDYDWRVGTTLTWFEIDRIDSQGAKEPPRWSKINIGDPVTTTYLTENWLKSTNSLLLPKEVPLTEADISEIPRAPYVFDYYNTNLVTDMLPNTIPVSTEGWNTKVRNWERKAGPDKHVSLWLILTDKEPSFADKLLWFHRGGQKNEVIMIYGVNSDGGIGWFRAHSFANGMNNNAMLQKLRQAALGEKVSDELLDKQLDLIYDEFHRQPGTEFKDLLFQSLSVSWWLIGILLLIQTAILIFVARAFGTTDFFMSSREYRLQQKREN